MDNKNGEGQNKLGGLKELNMYRLGDRSERAHDWNL